MIKKISLIVYLLVVVHTLSLAQNNIFRKLNSAYDEQNPILSPDGQTLYFTRSNDPNNVGGERDQGDIWFSQLGPTGWTTPQRARKVNSYDYNGVIGFADNKVILHNHYATGSLLKTQGISESTQIGSNEWSEPKNISIPYFKNLSRYFGGSLSNDGQAIVFSLESYDTRGAEDLYISVKEGGKWSEPKNLGDVLNTRFQELTPTFYNDSLLYFASNGHGGAGSTDIFVAQRKGDGWYDWSTPVNVEKINTEGRELGYRQYDDFAIYTSTVNSDGYGDIKLYTEADSDTLFNQAVTQDNITISEVKEEELSENEILLYGAVTSSDGESEVRPDVSVKQKDKTILSGIKVNVNEDLYTATLKSPGTYVVTVAAPGFIAQQESVELVSATAKKLQMNFALQPIAVGARVNLKNVLFKQSKAEIIDTSYPELNLVVDLMKENPSLKIRLEGHTDNRGLAKHNLRLSKKRVQAVEDYLVSKGISSGRVKGKGFGGSKPIADNNDPELRKLNRRVEFTI
ncbi:hypothetical protein E1176_03275, partial [Fulvivirga sp. RKSG066]|uniref:OmpA family protein n=1 Tax=Fulvivirga aurantia TaxID=2529383 RepID=UPI0012BD19AB